MAALSTALHGNYIPEIWSKTMESLFYPQLFLSWITNNKREGEIKNFGDTVNIRFDPDVTITTSRRAPTSPSKRSPRRNLSSC